MSAASRLSHRDTNNQNNNIVILGYIIFFTAFPVHRQQFVGQARKRRSNALLPYITESAAYAIPISIPIKGGLQRMWSRYTNAVRRQGG